MQLYDAFTRRHGERVESVEMKVGALAREVPSPHYYGFTWSPVGVATEYLEPSVVVREGAVRQVPSLSEPARLLIDGIPYEADLTSGGAANLPEHLAGRVRRLDYKTLRYPGHYDWVRGIIEEVGPDARALQARMEEAIPRVEDDVVVIYAAAEGPDATGARRRVSKSYVVYPVTTSRGPLRAIQATTAAALVESAKLLLTGAHRGLIRQTDIAPAPFLSGTFVGRVYR
jgi:saccharopine dehydrogenase-like NADP-dependent oxidoreductase